MEPYEASFLVLGPDFAVPEDLDLDRIKAKFLVSLTKIRWDKVRKDFDEVKRYRDKKDIEEAEKIEAISNMDRGVVNIQKGSVALGYKRCTEMKVNRRVIFSAWRPCKVKAILDMRYQIWMGIVKDYLEKETKEGVQL